jgi:hypothetical protein
VESAPLKDWVVCGRWIARGLVGSTRRSLARELARGFVASEIAKRKLLVFRYGQGLLVVYILYSV